MDTDYISQEAYNIITTASEFDDTLGTLIAAECSDCKDEEEFLQIVSEFIEEIKVDTADYLEDWGSENQLSVAQYRKKLKMLEIEIQKVKKIPFDKRTYEKV